MDWRHYTLRLKQIDSAFLTFSDEGHGVRKPENALLWYCIVLDWMNRHTKG